MTQTGRGRSIVRGVHVMRQSDVRHRPTCRRSDDRLQRGRPSAEVSLRTVSQRLDVRARCLVLLAVVALAAAAQPAQAAQGGVQAWTYGDSCPDVLVLGAGGPGAGGAGHRPLPPTLP